MTLTILLWLVVGTALIVAEIMTGTFYLLIFGIAAWIGAAVAYAGQNLEYQVGIAGVSAVVGLLGVRHMKSRAVRAATSGGDLDVGNEVRVETAEGTRLKVHYRGTIWDAVLDNGAAATLNAGDTGVISAVRGSLLVVQPAPR